MAKLKHQGTAFVGYSLTDRVVFYGSAINNKNSVLHGT